MARKIIIDTDPGIDDAMAIFYALASPELDLIGLTTVFGNAATSITTTNALRLLEIAGRPDIPVAVGAARSLTMPFENHAEIVHGVDGQGNTHLPLPKTKPVHDSAAQFLIDQIMSTPGEITLVPVAPLTNIALALLMKPEIAQNIREIVLMGGNAFAPGNITTAAEANIFNDPEAADIVFGADCPITMIGLDVTEKVYFTPERLDSIQYIDNPRAQHLARILPCYREFHLQFHGFSGIHAHDSTAITYLLNPSIFKTVQRPVRVETAGFSRGKTWPARERLSRERLWEGRRNVNICVDVDAEAAITMELERLAR